MDPKELHNTIPEDVARDSALEEELRAAAQIPEDPRMEGPRSPSPDELGEFANQMAEELRAKAEQAVKNRVPVSLTPSGKVRKNGPCPCGSGKKFKRCCLSDVKDPDNFKTLPTAKDMRAELKRKGLI